MKNKQHLFRTGKIILVEVRRGGGIRVCTSHGDRCQWVNI